MGFWAVVKDLSGYSFLRSFLKRETMSDVDSVKLFLKTHGCRHDGGKPYKLVFAKVVNGRIAGYFEDVPEARICDRCRMKLLDVGNPDIEGMTIWSNVEAEKTRHEVQAPTIFRYEGLKTRVYYRSFNEDKKPPGRPLPLR